MRARMSSLRLVSCVGRVEHRCGHSGGRAIASWNSTGPTAEAPGIAADLVAAPGGGRTGRGRCPRRPWPSRRRSAAGSACTSSRLAAPAKRSGEDRRRKSKSSASSSGRRRGARHGGVDRRAIVAVGPTGSLVGGTHVGAVRREAGRDLAERLVEVVPRVVAVAAVALADSERHAGDPVHLGGQGVADSWCFPSSATSR